AAVKAAALCSIRGGRACANPAEDERSGVGLGLQDLAAAVEAGRADVVAQVHFTSGRLDAGAGTDQCVVRTVHAALGRRLLVLLDGHGTLLGAPAASGRGRGGCLLRKAHSVEGHRESWT